MKAATHQAYGPPSVINIRQIDKPSISGSELLIKVHASTVNRTDTGFRSAEYFISRLFSGLLKPKNQVLGSEFAGEVVEIGKDVNKFKVGDKVFGFDDQKFGGCAEYKSIDQDKMLAMIPKDVSYENAAPILEGAHYSLFYIRAAKINKGQKVLINGGTGAIGSAALQILKSMGVHVTATSPTGQVKTVRSLGADQVIDWQKTDFTKYNDKFDVVFDAVGKSSFKKCKRLLKPTGIYMSSELGEHLQNPFLALKTKFIGKQKVLFPIPKNLASDADYLKGLVEEGSYAPLIDKAYSLDQIDEATEYVESGGKIGNVVIKIS